MVAARIAIGMQAIWAIWAVTRREWPTRALPTREAPSLETGLSLGGPSWSTRIRMIWGVDKTWNQLRRATLDLGFLAESLVSLAN
jgi:hypothetical protein